MYTKHYDRTPNSASDKTLTYCGFRKPHPHIDSSLIRLGFENSKEKHEIIGYFTAAIADAITIYERISSEFSNE